MTYERGSHTREMKTQHEAGEHTERADSNCRDCNLADLSERFTSAEQFHEDVLRSALTLEEVLSAHDRGEHAETADPACMHEECLNR